MVPPWFAGRAGERSDDQGKARHAAASERALTGATRARLTAASQRQRSPRRRPGHFGGHPSGSSHLNASVSAWADSCLLLQVIAFMYLTVYPLKPRAVKETSGALTRAYLPSSESAATMSNPIPI